MFGFSYFKNISMSALCIVYTLYQGAGRHYGHWHRQDCQSGAALLQALWWMYEEMVLVIIDSVEPGNHSLLVVREEEWMNRPRAMDSMNQGGLNIRDALKRRDRGKCNCKFCKV